MSIVREFYKTRNDGVHLYETRSDNNKMIRKVGTDEIYSSAIDVEDAPFEYEETDEEIVSYEEHERLAMIAETEEEIQEVEPEETEDTAQETESEETENEEIQEAE